MEFKVRNANYLSEYAMREVGRHCTELVSAVEVLQKILNGGDDFSFFYGPASVDVTIKTDGSEFEEDINVRHVHIISYTDGSLEIHVPKSVLKFRTFSRLIPPFLNDAFDAASSQADYVALAELCFGYVKTLDYKKAAQRFNAAEFGRLMDSLNGIRPSSMDTLVHATTRPHSEMHIPRTDVRALFAWYILNPTPSAVESE